VFFLSGLEIIEGPSDVILIPPETVAVFSCNLSEGALPAWRIGGERFFRDDVYPPGHFLDGSNLYVNMSVNGTEYHCILLLPNGTAAESGPGFLFIASKFMHTEN